MFSKFHTTAGIDVHKKWLYIVVGHPDMPERQFQRHRSTATTHDLRLLADWLHGLGVETVVMESTAQYWKPVWMALEEEFHLLLAQAHSNAAPHGRKTDYADATRLVRRLWSGDLRLSFVPEAEQRDWRMLTRARVDYTRQITRLRNRLESMLEECRIKISGLLSNLLGASGRRLLRALIDGTQRDPKHLAALADHRLRAQPEELEHALEGQLGEAQRLLLGQALNQIEFLETQMAGIEQCMARQMRDHGEQIRRLCAIPGLGVDSAQVILAELGPAAEAFPTAAHAASWVGVCPGRNESAGRSTSDASPKGNRQMRRVLNQCAWAAVRSKDTWWQQLFRQMVPRMGIKKALWAVAHRLLRVIWLVLHDGVEYVERGPRGSDDPERIKRRIKRLLSDLSRRGFNYQLTPVGSEA